MPSPYSPPWNWGPAGRRRFGENPNLRVSDADRTQVADRLSKHYADGRLDQAEFNERVEKAMSAKTQADLNGLLDDLPADPPLPEAARPRPPRRRHPILLIIALIILASVAWHLLWHPFFFFLPLPWLVIALVAFLLLRRRGSWRYRGGQGPQ